MAKRLFRWLARTVGSGLAWIGSGMVSCGMALDRFGTADYPATSAPRIESRTLYLLWYMDDDDLICKGMLARDGDCFAVSIHDESIYVTRTMAHDYVPVRRRGYTTMEME